MYYANTTFQQKFFKSFAIMHLAHKNNRFYKNNEKSSSMNLPLCQQTALKLSYPLENDHLCLFLFFLPLLLYELA